MSVDLKIHCDQTGELLKENGRNTRPHLTLKGAIFYQGTDTVTDSYGKEVNRYAPLTEQVENRYGERTARTYAFKDFTALADFFDQKIDDEKLPPLETYDDGKHDA